MRPLGEHPWALAPLAALYALRYGLVETLNFPLQPPGLRWQVPARWVTRRAGSVGMLTWGALLGPGLITRNPYAGIWLLPFLVGLGQNLLIAALVGGVHGTTRALGVLFNRHQACDAADVAAWRAQWRWRVWDGRLLLVGAGALAGHGVWALVTP